MNLPRLPSSFAHFAKGRWQLVRIKEFAAKLNRMTRRRWIADEVSQNRAVLTGDHAAHLARVLRARVGQEFDIITPTSVRVGRIISITESTIDFQLGEEIAAASAANITLALSIFKFDRMEWAIEKCTELGAGSIIPVIAQRTESHLASAAPKRRERWQRLALQASEQSRRSAPPRIAEPVKLKDAIAISARTRIVLSETETTVMLRDALPADSSDLVIALGPEGGWTNPEVKQFQDSGWISASLGPTILRAETAAIAALAIANALTQYD
jgi:16S rRNA (uracil1498-N3)-methyltransferase